MDEEKNGFPWWHPDNNSHSFDPVTDVCRRCGAGWMDVEDKKQWRCRLAALVTKKTLLVQW